MSDETKMGIMICVTAAAAFVGLVGAISIASIRNMARDLEVYKACLVTAGSDVQSCNSVRP